MIETGFASYAETPYTSGQNIDDVIRTLENNSVRLFKSLSNNQMKADKDHYTKMKLPIKDFFSKCDQIRSCGFGHTYWKNP